MDVYDIYFLYPLVSLDASFTPFIHQPDHLGTLFKTAKEEVTPLQSPPEVNAQWSPSSSHPESGAYAYKV